MPELWNLQGGHEFKHAIKCRIFFLTCVDCCGVMSRIIGTVTFAGILLYHLINTFIISGIVATSWVVSIGTTNEQFICIHFGKNSDIIITIIHRLSLHQTQFSISVIWVPSYSHIDVFLKISQTEIVDHVSSSDEKGGTILFEKFKMIQMCLVSNKCENLI